MKKIFAFILASIMILSLVPASAFAAITNCPKEHTLDNCEYTEIKTVPATCTTNGYVLYACDACGAQFVGEITEADGHIWTPNNNNTNRQNVDPVCAKKAADCKDGIRYVKCIVCDKAYKLVGDKAAADKSTVDNILYDASLTWENWFHSIESEENTLKYISGDGCNTIYQCRVCERKVNGKTLDKDQALDSHGKWIYSYTEQAPVWVDGEGIDGIAVYACEDCGDTKDVVIKAVHGEECTYVLLHEEIANNCEDDGRYAIYECAICDLLYAKIGDDFVEIDSVDDDKAVIPAHGHKIKDQNDDKKAPYDDEDECTKSGTCIYEDCRQEVTVVVHRDPYERFEYEDTRATCEDWGYQSFLCRHCGETWSETLEPPTGHNKVTVIIPSACEAYGYSFTYCSNENCDYEIETHKTKRGVRYDFTHDAEGNEINDGEGVALIEWELFTEFSDSHNFYLVLYNEGSCVDDYYAIQYCRDCDYAEEIEKLAPGHDFVEEGDDFVVDKNDDPEDYWPVIKEPTCQDEGEYKQYCKVCGEWIIEYVPVNDECTFVKKEVKSRCAGSDRYPLFEDKNGNKYYTQTTSVCLGCGDEQVTLSNRASSTSVKATFSGPDAYELANSTHFGAVYYNADGTVKEYSVQDGIFSFDLVDGSESEPTCLRTGAAVYHCELCGVNVRVILDKTAHNPDIDPEDLTADELEKLEDDGLYHPKDKPSCSAKTYDEYWTCQHCGKLYIYDEDGNQKVVKLADVTFAKHEQTLEYVEEVPCVSKAYYHCSGCCKNKAEILEGDKCNGVNKCYSLKKDMSSAFKKADLADKIKLDHDWKTLVATVKATCNTDGVMGAYYCADCSLLKLEISSIGIEKVDVGANNPLSHNGINLSLKYEYGYFTGAKMVAPNFTIDMPAFASPVSILYISDFDVDEYKYVDQQWLDVLKYENGEWVTPIIDKVNHTVEGVSVLNKILDDSHIHDDDCEVYDHPQYNHWLCDLCGYEYLDSYFAACEEHVNQYGDVLDYTCENWNEIPNAEDRVCVNCDQLIEAKHTIVVDDENATPYCTTTGYIFYYCSNPGCEYEEVIITGEPNPNNHLVNYDLTVFSDFATNGQYYQYCELCGKVLKNEAMDPVSGKGIEIYLSTEYENYTLGSYIDVTVSLASLKNLDVWGVNFTVDYEESAVEYVGAKFADGTAFTTHAAPSDTVIYEYEDVYDEEIEDWVEVPVPNKVVKVAANNANGVEIGTAEDLVVLTFKVVDVPMIPYISFAVVDGDAVSSTKKPVDVNYYDSPYTVNYTRVMIKTFLDLDGDWALTIADALELYTMIIFDAEYDTIADVNSDGTIDTTDLILLYEVLTGLKTPEDILNGEEEEEERVQKYDNEGNLIYDSYCDFDKSGAIDSVLEMSAMTGKIDPAVIWAGMED